MILPVDEERHSTTKPYLFFFTGLNIPPRDYEPIFSMFTETMNVFVVAFDSSYIDNMDQERTRLVDHIASLGIDSLSCICHSLSALFLYSIAELLPEVHIRSVFLDPTTHISIPSIRRNPKISLAQQEEIVQMIHRNETLHKTIPNLEVLLITYMNFERMKNTINTINHSKTHNYSKFLDFFERTSSMEQKRLSLFDDLYGHEKTHYLLLPLDERDRLKKVYPHFIHLHRPTQIVHYANQFFSLSNLSTSVKPAKSVKSVKLVTGGRRRTRKKKHKKNKRTRTRRRKGTRSTRMKKRGRSRRRTRTARTRQ